MQYHDTQQPIEVSSHVKECMKQSGCQLLGQEMFASTHHRTHIYHASKLDCKARISQDMHNC